MKTSEGSKCFAGESRLTSTIASKSFIALGAVTLLGQEEGLDYLDKARAFKIVNDEMTKKYYSAETQAIQDSFSPHIPECATNIDQEVAVNLLSSDPMSTPERLYGVGLDGNRTLRWEVIGVSERRRRKATATTFDVRVGTIDSMVLNERMLICLIRRTAEVYLRHYPRANFVYCTPSSWSLSSG